MTTKGVKVRPARPAVKPANKQLRTSVGDKVNIFTYCGCSLGIELRHRSFHSILYVYRIQLSLHLVFLSFSMNFVVECSSAVPSLYWWKHWMLPPLTMYAALSPMMKSSHLSEYWWNCFWHDPHCCACLCLWFKWVFACFLRYDSRRVVQQLRACGVLETIRISAQSYPSRWFSITRLHISQTKSPYAQVVIVNMFFLCRWTYIEFYSRYSILMSHQEGDLSDKKQTCKNVLQRLIQVSCFFSYNSVMHYCALHVCA